MLPKCALRSKRTIPEARPFELILFEEALRSEAALSAHPDPSRGLERSAFRNPSRARGMKGGAQATRWLVGVHHRSKSQPGQDLKTPRAECSRVTRYPQYLHEM